LKWQEADYFFMSRALQLARRGMNSTHPNPRVGAVIVRDNRIVSEGWHEFSGAAHAEINALENLTGSAAGATCYVTLEPCNHIGRTGPCTEALIDAEIASVIVAVSDPNPLVAGQGLARLAEAGIETQIGLMQDEAVRLNQGFIMRVVEKRPYVRCKLAMSLDGKTATASGESKWITEAAARSDVQKLRAKSSAILTGIGTVLADDPGLDVREIDIGKRQVLRVVLDRELRMPVSAKMLALPGRTLVFTFNTNEVSKKEICAAGAELVVMEEEGQNFLSAVLRYLAEHEEINEILLEAGAELSGAMLEQGLVDEIILYQAPTLMGDSGRGLFHLPSIKTMKDKLNLELIDTRMIGRDRRMSFRVNNQEPEY
jgi:diaminohydroxyphosphoribosylaminopyrimidine deaminase/5-amino-6-(5-phosphoribosylamino)uracil reductase